MYSNKIKGMLTGVALGDALGAPHEFSRSKLIFKGELIYPITITSRFHGIITYPVGTVTDDTQMTLALARQISIDGKYNENNVILAYERFAKDCKFCGKNTRNLFKGVVTTSGYRNRYSKFFTTPMDEWTQSNGSLMRCSPLVVFPGYEDLISDTKLSNPHPNNIECAILYMYVLKSLLIKDQPPELEELFKYCKQPDVISLLNDVKNKKERDIAPKSIKGWICTSLYCALYSVYNVTDITTAFDKYIKCGGDTDTNAAIIGSLYGAKLGYTQLKEVYDRTDNINILFTTNQILNDIDEISNILGGILGK